MSAVLFAPDQSALARSIATELVSAGHAVRRAGSRDDALAALARVPVDVVVCEAPASECAGEHGLIGVIRRAAPRATALFLVGDAPADDAPGVAAELRLPCVMRPPFAAPDVLARVRGALEARRGFLGSVSGLPLVEVLQMFNVARRTASLLIEGAAAGRIDFEHGQVVHAECGAARGVAAFRALLAAPGGRFRTVSRAGNERSIDSAFDLLLMSSRPADADVSADDAVDGEIDGLDGLRSWCPAPADPAPALVIPTPAQVPSGLMLETPSSASAHGSLPPSPSPPVVPPSGAPPPSSSSSSPPSPSSSSSPPSPSPSPSPPSPSPSSPSWCERWRAAFDALGAQGAPGVALVVERATGAASVLRGAAPDEALLAAVLDLYARFAPLALGSAHGRFEHVDGALALALLWDAAEDSVLVLADAVGAEGVAGFRAHVAALARRVAAASRAPGGDDGDCGEESGR